MKDLIQTLLGVNYISHAVANTLPIATTTSGKSEAITWIIWGMIITALLLILSYYLGWIKGLKKYWVGASIFAFIIIAWLIMEKTDTSKIQGF